MKRLLGLILLILAIVGTIGVAKNLSKGDAIKQTGNAAYDNGQRVGRYSGPGVLAAMLVYGLRLLFSSDDSSKPPPPRRNPIGSNLPPPDPRLRGALDTYASNPGRLRPNLLKWFGTRPGLLALYAFMLLFGLWMLVRVHPLPGVAILLACPIVVYRTVREARQKFYGGCINPGIVVSAAKGLVAAHTDLSVGGGTRPAVKVVKQPLGKMLLGPAQDGMRVATAALYYRPVRESAWSNFDPEVVNCFVDSEDEIARVLDSIPEDEWLALENALPQIPLDRPGLYRLWGGHAAHDATPWLQRTPVIIGLSVLGALAVLAGGMNLLSWSVNRARERREAAAVAENSPNQPMPAARSPRPEPSMPVQNPPTTPAPTAPTPTPLPKPTPAYLELNGRVVSVTNISGRVFDSIKLVRADPSGIIYTVEGGGGKLALSTLPAEFLKDLGLPDAWIQASVASATAAANPAPKPKGLVAGAAVQANWAGKWIPGTITEVNHGGFTVMVQLQDPRWKHPIVLSTNQIRLQ